MNGKIKCFIIMRFLWSRHFFRGRLNNTLSAEGKVFRMAVDYVINNLIFTL